MKSLKNLLLFILAMILFSCEKEKEIDSNESRFIVSEIEYISSPKKLNVGDMAPNFILNPESVNAYKFNEFRNNVVLMYFGASWCTICKTFEPKYLNVVNEFKNQDVEFFKVFVDYKKNDFENKSHEFDMKLYSVYDDRSKENLMGLFDVSYFPFLAVVDKDGVIRYLGNPQSYDFNQNINQLLSE